MGRPRGSHPIILLVCHLKGAERRVPLLDQGFSEVGAFGAKEGAGHLSWPPSCSLPMPNAVMTTGWLPRMQSRFPFCSCGVVGSAVMCWIWRAANRSASSALCVVSTVGLHAFRP
ncbi:hypothetical protein LY78DRAFT_475908 [Colletotrichum sublineola]|nr:hypothetical protein LY78DRAFT_475908 [Colletotrichum sublineola]